MSNPLAKYIKAPFKADFMGGIVWSAEQFHFADVRGWGELGYKGDGAKIQDFNLQFMVDALNEKAARDAKPAEDIEDMKKELEWLRWYRREVYACLGPADDDINRSIREAFVKKHGMDALPKQERIWYQEYLDDHPQVK